MVGFHRSPVTDHWVTGLPDRSSWVRRVPPEIDLQAVGFQLCFAGITTGTAVCRLCALFNGFCSRVSPSLRLTLSISHGLVHRRSKEKWVEERKEEGGWWVREKGEEKRKKKEKGKEEEESGVSECVAEK
jgi:hypothetical protein